MPRLLNLYVHDLSTIPTSEGPVRTRTETQRLMRAKGLPLFRVFFCVLTIGSYALLLTNQLRRSWASANLTYTVDVNEGPFFLDSVE